MKWDTPAQAARSNRVMRDVGAETTSASGAQCTLHLKCRSEGPHDCVLEPRSPIICGWASPVSSNQGKRVKAR
jgi:hypothetical protein